MLGQPQVRTYYYNPDGTRRIQPGVSHSNSNARGRIMDIFGFHWQSAADTLWQVAAVFGTIGQIDLSYSQTNQGYLNFVIYYHEIDAAQKFANHMHKLILLGSSNISDLTWCQTPLMFQATEPYELPQQNQLLQEYQPPPQQNSSVKLES